MRAYVITTGAVFAMLVIAHVWRVAVEGMSVAASVPFAVTTIVSLALAGWAIRVLRHLPHRS